MLNVRKNSQINGFKTVLVKLNGIYYAFQVEIFFPFSENAMMYQISFPIFHFHSRLCSRVAAV